MSGHAGSIRLGVVRAGAIVSIGDRDVLEDGLYLRVVNSARIRVRRELVEGIANNDANIGDGLCLAAPVENQSLVDVLEQPLRDATYLLPLMICQPRPRLGEQVEDRKLFFAEVFACCPLLLPG